MSGTNIPDRRSPDHNWTGNGSAASNDDLADAVAHLKAWFTRELAKLKAPTIQAPTPPPAPVSPPSKATTSGTTSGTSGA